MSWVPGFLTLEDPSASAGALRVAGWTTLGLAGAALITGVSLTIASNAKQTDLDDGDREGTVTPESRAAANGFIDDTSTASYVMYGLSGAAAIAATTLLVLGHRDNSTAGQLRPRLHLTRGGFIAFIGGRL